VSRRGDGVPERRNGLMVDMPNLGNRSTSKYRLVSGWIGRRCNEETIQHAQFTQSEQDQAGTTSDVS